MTLEAIYRRPSSSRAAPEHRVFPYLLRGLLIDGQNQAWTADITYIPMARGVLYLVAIMDGFSRHVMAWQLSNTLEADVCVNALEEALALFGGPGIFNSDQGCQFTSQAFTGVLEAHGIRISIDGKGRFMDNLRSPYAAPPAPRSALSRRTPVAEPQVRGGVPEGLRQRARGAGRDRRLAGLLQRGKAPTGPRLADSTRGFRGRARPLDKWKAAKRLPTSPQAQQQQDDNDRKVKG